MRLVNADDFDRMAKEQHAMWAPMMGTDEKYKLIDIGFMLAAGVLKGMPTVDAPAALREIDALRAERDALQIRCDAAEDDLAVERGCLSCWYMDKECPRGCSSKTSTKWRWRGPDRPGCVPCAPGGAPVNEVCQRS